jgi:hypothetical protein
MVDIPADLTVEARLLHHHLVVREAVLSVRVHPVRLLLRAHSHPEVEVAVRQVQVAHRVVPVAEDNG